MTNLDSAPLKPSQRLHFSVHPKRDLSPRVSDVDELIDMSGVKERVGCLVNSSKDLTSPLILAVSSEFCVEGVRLGRSDGDHAAEQLVFCDRRGVCL